MKLPGLLQLLAATAVLITTIFGLKEEINENKKATIAARTYRAPETR